MEFLVTVLVIFVVFGWLMKKIFPFLLAWYIKRRMKKGNGAVFGQFGEFGEFGQFWQQGEDEMQNNHRKDEEGKVTVVTMDQKEKVIEKNMGEYIDFEEEK